MSEHDEVQGEMAEQADLELARRRSGKRSTSDEAKDLGMRTEQLQEVNFAVLKARRVLEAHLEVEANAKEAEPSPLGRDLLYERLRDDVGKLLDRVEEFELEARADTLTIELLERVAALETQSAARFRIMQAIDGEVSGLRRDVGEMKARVEIPCSDEDLRLKFGDLWEKFKASEERLAMLEWAAKLRKPMDPLDAAVEAGLFRADTPETLDPDLSDEAQAEARVSAVTKVIGNAIGVIQGVCSPGPVRAVAVHTLTLAMGAAKDAAKAKAP